MIRKKKRTKIGLSPRALKGRFEWTCLVEPRSFCEIMSRFCCMHTLRLAVRWCVGQVVKIPVLIPWRFDSRRKSRSPAKRERKRSHSRSPRRKPSPVASPPPSPPVNKDEPQPEPDQSESSKAEPLIQEASSTRYISKHNQMVSIFANRIKRENNSIILSYLFNIKLFFRAHVTQKMCL